MKKFSAAAFTLLLLATSAPAARQSHSADLLQPDASLATLIRKSSDSLRRNPTDLNALLVQMECARLALNDDRELSAALALLESALDADDSRAQLAARRVAELSANTRAFRSALPRINRLLQRPSLYSRSLSEALLNGASDGVRFRRAAAFTAPITRWQIAGPFGKYSNVDFEHAWPAEHNQLLSASVGDRAREQVSVQNGRLDLPDYLPRSGVYYVASNIQTPQRGRHRLTIESEGTFQVFLDGRNVLTHDARFRQLPSVMHSELELSAGRHRLMLKLHASALPIRVWVEAPLERRHENLRIAPAVRSYVSQAIAVMEGNASPQATAPDNVLGQFARAEQIAQDGDTEAANNLLTSIVAANPGALRAYLQLAQQAFGDDQFENATRYLAIVLRGRPRSHEAQELRYRLAAHFGWGQEQREALTQRLLLHPSCSAWQDAAKLYSTQEEFDKTKAALDAMANCSNAPYAYWSELSDRGEHSKALPLIEQFLRKHGSDRRALIAAIREAVLSGHDDRATQLATRLTQVAPNSEWATRIAAHPETVLDSRAVAMSSNPENFWSTYTRDPLPLMSVPPQEPTDARLLINDKVIDLGARGDAWIYTHIVWQVFDKRGIEEVGEVSVPRAAELLTLQTVKADATHVQPEVTDAKATVSMPSLEAGDSVEIAYLQHFTAETLDSSPHELDFSYTSAGFLTQSAQLTLIRDEAREPVFVNAATAKPVLEDKKAGKRVTTWTVPDQPAQTEEPAAPEFDRRPVFRFMAVARRPPQDDAARLRDRLIMATRVTPTVEHIAAEIHAFDPQQRLAAAYEKVVSTVASNDESWLSGSISSADESFRGGEGNRTAALIALLAAMGFNADLELAAEYGSYNPAEDCALQSCYRFPLVRVSMPDHSTKLLDVETDGLAAGALSPHVEGQPALIVTRTHADGAQLAKVPLNTDQRSVATAVLDLDVDGNISGSFHIRFGSLRGAQVRTALRSMSASERRAYFEQIAGRILPNPHGVSASMAHENDTSRPLELDLQVASAGVERANGSQLDIGQVIPALGLSRLYASLPQRRQDLFLETPLIETSEFLVRLAPGLQLGVVPQTVNLHTEFGDYRTEFRREGPNQLKIVRSFGIPVQMVSPAKYPAFTSFALQIDSAERQPITLERTAITQTATVH